MIQRELDVSSMWVRCEFDVNPLRFRCELEVSQTCESEKSGAYRKRKSGERRDRDLWTPEEETKISRRPSRFLLRVAVT